MNLLTIFEGFEMIEANSSRNVKESYLESIRLGGENDEALRTLLMATSDPYKNYWVTASENGPTMLGLFSWSSHADEIIFATFKQITERLATRQVTGNAAREELEKYLSTLNPLYRKWFARIINRSLPYGLGWSTIKKILVGGWPPDFGVMLADSMGESFEVQKPMWAEPKLDGLRCIFILDPNNPQVLSRNGKPLKNQDALLAKLFKYSSGYVLDGELFAGSWEASMSAAKGGGHKDQKFWAFDMIPLEDFRSGKSKLSLESRASILRNLNVPDLNNELIVVQHKIIESTEQAFNVAREFHANGFEGAVVKDPEAPYETIRSNSWLKVKPLKDGDYKIVDFAEGGGRLRGSCGTIIVDVDGVRVGVGTGLSDAVRKDFWLNKEKYLGKVMQVVYQDKTPDGSLRFPRYVRMREDK